MDISPLIRNINAKSFSEKAHSPGYWLVYDHRNQQVKQAPNKWGKLLGQNKHFSDYFVKMLEKPLVVSEIRFKWSEGTSDIGLDFKATFQIFVDNEDEAKELVKQLFHSEGPAKALYKIIDKHLHHEMTLLYDQVRDVEGNLLDCFYKNTSDAGESIQLDRSVSSAIVDQLKLSKSHFRIGFQLENAPPRQVEVEQTSKLNLADTNETANWKVLTSAMLVLNNYQRCKKSGLKDKQSIINKVEDIMDAAVQQHLFKPQFFELIANFQKTPSLSEENSLRYKLEQQIKADVFVIGYDLELFQTLPNVPLLKLIDGLRVDISNNDEDCEFNTKGSAGHVKLNVALDVTVNDFKKLKYLIDPADISENLNISKIIRTHVIQICKDEIQKIERKKFNLAFDKTNSSDDTAVYAILEQAFKTGLGKKYGLTIDVIHITQAQTEDGERFQALLSKEWFFYLNISPQADEGEGDHLKYQGVFEMVSIATDGWEAFESKNFGFRRDSHERTPVALRELRNSLDTSISDKELETEWKNFCIKKELDAIASRIKMNLEEHFSKVENIANSTRTVKESEKFRDISNKVAKIIIAKDFGLEIEIKALQRMDSEIDLEMQLIQKNNRKIRIQTIESEVEKNKSYLEGQQTQIKKVNEVRLKKLEDSAELSDDPEFDIDIAKLDEEQEMIMKNAIKKPKLLKKRNIKSLSQDMPGILGERNDDES